MVMASWRWFVVISRIKWGPGNADGSLISGWPVNAFGTVESEAALGDLDGDGDLEIVIGRLWRDRLPGEPYGVNAWHGDGSPVDGYPIPVDYWTRWDPLLADADRDGDIEVIIVSNCDGNIRAYNHDGTSAPGFPISLGILDTSPSAADLDIDNDLDLVIPSGSSMYALDLKGMASEVEWGNFQHDPQHSGQYGFSPDQGEQDPQSWKSGQATGLATQAISFRRVTGFVVI
jgi:hypothetical protein